MRNACSIWCMTWSYSKTSIFVRPRVNEKAVFLKISTLESVFEKIRCQWPFSPDTCGRWANRRKNLCFQSGKFMRGLGFNYVSRLHHICNCKRRVLSTLTLSQYTVRRLNQMFTRRCRSKVELIQLGSAHEKYGVWTRPKSTREWVNKINLSSFQIKNFSKFLLGWSARENQNILTSQPCLHTLMQTRLSANQSEYTMLDI